MPAAFGPPIPEAEALENARLIAADLRTQIDYQIRSAESMDTKAWALVTATGLIAGLVAPRVVLDTDVRSWSALVVFLVAIAMVVLCMLTIRPLANFAYGPNPASLIVEMERWSHVALVLAFAESMKDAREKNVIALDAKSTWYQYALITFGGVLVGIGWLVYVGAIS